MFKYDINEEQFKELIEVRKSNKNKLIEKRLEVLVMRANGYGYKEIAAKTGFHISYVSQLVVKFAKEGLPAILGKERPGRPRNMAPAEEKELLQEFSERAEKGEIVSIDDIRDEYKKRIGKDTHENQIYKVLKRNNWRKVKPRGKHPKQADGEAAGASKKLTV